MPMRARPPVESTPLQRARCAKDLTQADLASRIGLTQSGYSKIERGLTMPSVRTAARIALEVGATISELWPDLATAEVSS